MSWKYIIKVILMPGFLGGMLSIMGYGLTSPLFWITLLPVIIASLIELD